MTEDPVSEELAVSLAHMMRHLFAQGLVESTLDRVATYAVSTVEECEEASILMLGRGRQLTTLTSTSWWGQESDRLQTELGEGRVSMRSRTSRRPIGPPTWPTASTDGHGTPLGPPSLESAARWGSCCSTNRRRSGP